jgi:GAF domain-containing protein
LSGEQSRAQVEERAALRRVATLLARGVALDEVFAAVTEEAGRSMSVEEAHLGRYESDGTITMVAGWGRRGDHVSVTRRWSRGELNISSLVFETGRPARIDDCADASGLLDVVGGEDGFGSGVGTPVIV